MHVKLPCFIGADRLIAGSGRKWLDVNDIYRPGAVIQCVYGFDSDSMIRTQTLLDMKVHRRGYNQDSPFQMQYFFG
jgi:hypothetical protein